jgi:ABC-2 type transport system permease protein
VTPGLRAVGRPRLVGPVRGLRALVDVYDRMRNAVAEQFQYRVANYFYMIGMVAEPVIYLVVWSTIAEQQGGSVGGFTPGQFAAYYIVWTLVRNMNIVFTPYGWEWRIREGQLSGMLLRPLTRSSRTSAYFAGWKSW